MNDANVNDINAPTNAETELDELERARRHQIEELIQRIKESADKLQLDNVKAPVVFDDPVTSLDHYIIDAVARRLVKLSRERQVIVFTHSILMFNSIRQRNDSPSFSDIQSR